MLRVVALALVAAASSAAADANPRPVVGILVQPLQPDVASDQPLLRYGSMYLPASYVKLVEAAGARVAPVFYNSTAAQLKALFARLSGLVLPGGHVSILDTSYADAVYSLLDLAAAEPAPGFPVHGTCMGSQQMAQWASGAFARSVLSATDAEQLLLPLAPVAPNWDDSWLLAGAPADVLAALTRANATVNLHHYGVTPSKFDAGGTLDTGALRPLATSTGADGVEFVALYEGAPADAGGRGLPWSASQYHPEKNAFEWSEPYDASAEASDVAAAHSDAACDAALWLMRRLVSAARNAPGHAWNDSDARFPLIREFAPVPGGPDSGFNWESCYFW